MGEQGDRAAAEPRGVGGKLGGASRERIGESDEFERMRVKINEERWFENVKTRKSGVLAKKNSLFLKEWWCLLTNGAHLVKWCASFEFPKFYLSD